VTKALSYRLFRLGGVPKRVRLVLANEGIVVWDEGMRGRFITNDLKAPGRRSIHRSEGFSGWLAITQQRVLCYTYRKRQINISIDDPKLSELFVCTPDPQTLSLSFDPLFCARVGREWSSSGFIRKRRCNSPMFWDLSAPDTTRLSTQIKRLARQDRLISEKRHALD